jgi:hypothetical protein
MATDLKADRTELRALLTASMLGLPDYSFDCPAIRRVGKLIAEAAERAADERRFGKRGFGNVDR